VAQVEAASLLRNEGLIVIPAPLPQVKDIFLEHFSIDAAQFWSGVFDLQVVWDRPRLRCKVDPNVKILLANLSMSVSLRCYS
jgi:hypothetical protein